MKILQLCNKPPLPATDGGCIAMNTLTQGLLEEGHEVKILTIETAKHPMQWDKLPDEYRRKTRIESVFVNTSVNLLDAFSALVTSDSYNVSRFFSRDFEKKLIAVLHAEAFDVVQLESLFMTPYLSVLRKHSKARIVLRSHNLEYMIWKRMAEASKNRAKRTYLKILAKQLKKYETGILNQVDGIAAISREDEEKFRALQCKQPLLTIPFGIDSRNYPLPPHTPDTFSLFHIGSMDWTPNREGIDWFVSTVWPVVRQELPGIGLHLAGRKMPQELLQSKAPGLHVHGEVQDAHAFMAAHSVMIVPLHTAGGMRVKIIEAMAMGKPVITTRTGAEGINYTEGKHLLIADTPTDFAKAIRQLHDDPAYYSALSAEARKLIESEYDAPRLTRRLVEFYESLSSGAS